MSKNRDLTSGGIMKNIVFLSLPFLLSYFLQTLYSLADLFIIGQYCDVDGIDAVSIGGQVMHVLTVMIIGLAMGATVLIGKAVGGKKTVQRNILIGNTASLFLLLSVVLTVILLIGVNAIVSLLETPAEAVEGTTTYLRICFAGIPFITAYNIISAVYRGMGDSKSPMYFVAIACVFNILLDLFLVGHLNMGPAGAAWGTVLAQVISVLIAISYIRFNKSIEGIQRVHFKLRRVVAQKILRIGIPVCAQDFFIQISFILITIFCNRRGLDDSAAACIVEKIIGIFFLVPSSLLSSVSTICAQSFGARQIGRAKKTLYYAIGIATCMGFLFSIIVQFCSADIVALFTSDAHVVALGGGYLKSYVWDCMFAGVHFCFSGYFCAYGRSEFSFIHNIISIVTARIPLAYLASVTYADTLYPMGWAAPIGSFISIIVCVIAYLWLRSREKQKQN